MDTEQTRIVEIGGVKLEVDLRHARTVERYRIGDNVKVLRKQYGDTWESFPGVIVGFDNFVARPTIVIAYLMRTEVKFLYLNADSKDAEICPMVGEELLIDKDHMVGILDREITEREAALVKAKAEREYFLTNFGRYFKPDSDE